MLYNNDLYVAEREGFEPPIRLPVCRISSAVLSTTQPPLQAFERSGHFALMAKRDMLISYRIATEFPSGASLRPPAKQRQLFRRHPPAFLPGRGLWRSSSARAVPALPADGSCS